MAMRLPQFFRQIKPRNFNYRPIFYDRKKELLNQRVKEGLKGDLFVPSIHKGSLREYHSLRHRSFMQKGNLRMLVILVLLVLVIVIIILF